MKLSIIIPTIGRKTLRKVLESIFSCRGFERINPEILVIFDGKKDDFFLNSFGEKIITLETGKQLGAGGARNLGIKKSIGDVLVFIGDNGVPDKNWLERVFEFHQKFPEPEKALLGKVFWLGKDDFTDFFQKNVQFDFQGIKKHGADWRHFYTSNVSIKRGLLEMTNDEGRMWEMVDGKPVLINKSFEIFAFFNEKFKGWGFEDSELGYRLEKKGMKLIYDENCQISRLDVPTLPLMIEKTKSARKNAEFFEKCHPEIKILPQGLKLYFLKFIIWILGFLGFIPRVKCWRAWKRAWIRD